MEKKLQFLKKATFALLALVGFSNFANAQCAAGEVEITIDVTTDAYGYETYWEIVPTGNGCGNGTIISGGNTLVGCGGQGAQAQNPGGYANSTTVTEGPVCLTIGQDYDLISVDDWGDAGANYVILSQGVDVTQASGSMLTYTFTAQAPIAEDIQALKTLGVEYTRIPMTQVNAALPLMANVRNNGTADVTDAVLTVDVFMDPDYVTPVQTTSSAPTNITSGSVVALDATTFMPASVGNYTFRYLVSASSITDSDVSNDTLYYNVTIGPDGMYARDNGDVVVNLGLNSPSEGLLGNVFDINVAAQMDSVFFFEAMSNAGDTTYIQIYDVVAGVPTTQVGMSAEYYSTAADAAGLTVTLPVTDMVGAPLVLSPGKYFVALHDSKSGFLGLGFTSAIYTPGGTMANVNGGVFGNMDALGFPNPAVIRPYVNNITVGINEEALTSGLTAQPNPTTGLFTVNVGNDNVSLTVTTVEGKVVKTINNTSNIVNIDLTNEENGIYFVTVKGENTNSTFKVVKQ